MFEFLKRRRLTKRGDAYLKMYPADEPAVQAIVVTVLFWGPRPAREIAEMLAKRRLTENEWAEYGPRWQRACDYIQGENP